MTKASHAYRSQRTVLTALFAGLLATVMAPFALAEPIIHESFDGSYKVGEDLVGQKGGNGLSGNWQASEGVSIQVAKGLSLGKLPTSGKAMSLTRSGEINSKRFAFCPMKGTGTKSELWISYLARWTKDNGGKGHSATVGIGPHGHADDDAFRIHTNLLSINEENRFAVGYGSRLVKTTNKSNVADKTVLVVGRWAGLVGDEQHATIWVFDSAKAVDAVLAAKSVDVLDKHAFTKQTVKGLLGSFGKDNGLKIGGFIGGDPGAYTITIDELRLGHAAGDVLPGAQLAAADTVASTTKAVELKPLAVGGRTIYVAVDGDDSSADPTKAETPLRTIGKAAAIALAGDVIEIRKGVYRESVRVQRVASASHPIVFRPHKDDKVVVSGVDVVTGKWEKVEGDKPIYVVALKDRFKSKQTQSDQVFVDGRMIDVARHPNFAPLGDRMQPGNWFTVDGFVGSHKISGETEWGKIEKGPSERVTIVAEEVEAADGYWNDAQVWIKPEQGGISWGFGRACPVIEHKGKRLTFDMAGEVSDFSTIGPGIRFFFYDKKELLDAPGEWWLDRKANKLYVWLPDGSDPNDHTIEVKRRDWAFDLTDSAHVTLKDIHVFGATITTDNEYSDGRGGGGWLTNNRDSQNPDVAMGNARAHHITLDGVRAQYVSHFMGTWGFLHDQWTSASGIQLVGEDHVMKNCLVAYSAGNGVSVFGYRHKLVNNVIHDVAYSGALASGIYFQHGTQTPTLPTDYEVTNNTLYRGGWGLIDCSNLYSSDPKKPSRIHHNFIEASGLLTKDVGGIRFVGHTKEPHPVNGTRVDHNIVRGCVAALGNAIYFDFNNGYQADHNIVYHSTNMMNINDAHDILVAYNTGHTFQGGIGGNPKRTKFRNVTIVNNLTNRGVPDRVDRLDPSYVHKHNITTDNMASMVVDLTKADFRLANGSPAIDAGMVVPGLSHNMVGKAPDVGALEHGGDDWTSKVGADWTHEPAPSHLKVTPHPDGRVDLAWTHSDAESHRFIVERGYKTDHPNGGWEYIIVARTKQGVTKASDKIDSAYREFFYRVRTEQSHYCIPVVLKAGHAGHTQTTFEPKQGYKPGPIDGQTNWIGVDGSWGIGRGRTDMFQVVKDGAGNHLLAITGDNGKATVAALSNLAMIDKAFAQGKKQLHFSFQCGLRKLTDESDAKAARVQIGGISFWQGPNDDLVAFELMRDGTIKASWKQVGKLSDYGVKPGELVTITGVLDMKAGTCDTVTINGKQVEVGLKFKTEGRDINNALWQISGSAKDAEHAALIDDLTLHATGE